MINGHGIQFPPADLAPVTSLKSAAGTTGFEDYIKKILEKKIKGGIVNHTCLHRLAWLAGKLKSSIFR